MLMGYFQSHC